jgi:tetratricopeptide (TPR) repeat protein
LIEKVITLAVNLTPIALVGAGGIGKTCVALTVLHDSRIKGRFGDNRRFIRCDRFPPSYAHFVDRLSKVVGAGIENPEDFSLLRPFLSSKEMLIILDNAESVLDPRGKGAQEIYAVVEELSQFQTVCLCITSRISTVPPHCERLVISTLSFEAACNVFYSIYNDGGRSDIITDLLQRLDFHALSITLLATVAFHNMWGHDRIAKEWDTRRTQLLRTDYNESLAATIELSLTSPTFRGLGPDARDLLSVVAFFPQGIGENNLDWLFPTVPNRTEVFDKFCVLSLTYRSDGFFTMLAPLRDYLSPKDPKSSPFLRMTKEIYFTRMSVNIDPNEPNFGETRWITSEDINVEYLLDVFTTIDADSYSVWSACFNFMGHLYWHKKRPTILQPKIEGLPDGHGTKPACLSLLSWLFYSVGNYPESKRLISHALKLYRAWGDDYEVAQALRHLSDTNRLMDLHDEGIHQAKEALEICGRLGNTAEQAHSLIYLALLLCKDQQLDLAEEAAFRAINLLPEKGKQYLVCGSHRLLGYIYQSKGETERAIHHDEVALGIASSFDWRDHLFWVHYKLAGLFRNEGRLEDAQAHVERAKSHTVNSTYYLGYAMEEQASLWYGQHRLGEARSEALRAADVYEKLGAVKGVEECRKLLRWIEEE